MVIDSENPPICQCRVLYIGSAVPLERAKGLEAIQQPLSERYLVDEEKSISGVDAVLAVLSSEIQMTYAGDSKTVVCFPISTLTFCAAVRCIHVMNSQGVKVPRFVSLNSPAAGGIYAQRPAIFAAITRRMKGRKVLECHAYLCATPTDAKNLVQASKMADRAYRGGMGITSLNSVYGNSRVNTLNSRPVTASEVHLIPADQRSTKTDVPQEFFDVPPTRGYFYSAGSDHVKNYTVERVADGLPNGNTPNEARTLDRPTFRRVAPLQPNMAYPMIPPQAQYVRHVAPMSMKKGGPILVNTLPPPKRFLSPPPHPMIARNGTQKDPYLYMQSRVPGYPAYAYRVPVQPPIHRSPLRSHSSERSGEIPKANLSPSNSAKANTQKGATVAENGNDGSSSSDSSRPNSRPNSPPRDYERLTAPDIHKSRLSRREQQELQKGSLPLGLIQPMIYPYDPYTYPAYYVAQPMHGRPRSLPPPMMNKNASKVWRKKEKKSKKKTKGKASDDASSDHFGYTSEVPMGRENYLRSSVDGQRSFQNERAFARSIAEETKRRSFTQIPTAYGQFDETDVLY